ncbi:winged helix-turn-helix transcriptional regulator [Pararhodobacter zhoushanensis]|uniref:Helix-turn-helix transcriptional regulator n=1 Tax=Pararhodobacter zhoushanensis TaxID=2479545 RepID=A0ABT3GX39_9RHOB|nr:helix-turn-helix domain-containing protein [Pararhodobacter zhoushanensis]MCW1932109.1 helix-turn-helix transcriptional regulator [Pararhodobacter zhoushanensis]
MLTADPCRPDQCLAEDWLGFLGHRWNALTLWQLEAGPRRFSDLQDRLPGISPKVLTERLEGLQARGLVSRQVSNGFPRTVTYALTVQGAGLRGVLMHLYDWAETLPVMGAENTNAAL